MPGPLDLTNQYISSTYDRLVQTNGSGSYFDGSGNPLTFPNGTSGTSGIDGTSGTSGTSGQDGTSGTSGTSGQDGTSGTSGQDGTSGTNGPAGTSGTSGTSGQDGTSGTNGPAGTSGTSGTSIPSLTSGSVLFSNGTTIAQDNANLFWDDTNNRLGIGTNAPAYTLDVVGNDARINTLTIGLGAGQIFNNTAVGTQALLENTTGAANTAVGYFALENNTTGSNNTALGYASLLNNLTTSNHTAVGLSSLRNITSGSYNTALGNNAGRYIADETTTLTTSNVSLFLGSNTKALANSQTNQIVIGYDATGLGSNSVVLGNSSITLTALRGNVLIGTTTDAGYKLDVVGNDARINTLTVGLGGGQQTSNTAIGVLALSQNTTGTANTAVGYLALASSNTTGTSNSAFGYLALRFSAGGSNCAFGTTALYGITSGSSNSAFGRDAGYYIADGVTAATSLGSSVFIGANTKALANNQTNQIVIGQNAIGLGSNSVVLGNSSITLTALRGNVLINTTTDAGYKLDVVGGDARFNSVKVGLGGNGSDLVSVAVGASALNANTSGVSNTAIGYFTLSVNITGNNNTALGSSALRNSTQTDNTSVGSTSFLNLSSGSANTALGRNAARYIADGSTSLTIADQSVFIGSQVKALANSQTNQIVIGYNAIGLGSNSVVLGNSSITLTALRGNVLIGTTTDAGYKLDVNGTARVSGTTTITPAALTGTAATSALDIAQTWNTTGTPIALKVNITDTASAALSDLISLQVGGAVRFRVVKSGYFVHNTGGEIAGTVVIGSSSINASSQLEVTSTTRGFLPPRMTTTQKNAITTPAAGLMVYDNTINDLQVYNGTSWLTKANGVSVYQAPLNLNTYQAAVGSGNTLLYGSPYPLTTSTNGNIIKINAIFQAKQTISNTVIRFYASSSPTSISGAIQFGNFTLTAANAAAGLDTIGFEKTFVLVYDGSDYRVQGVDAFNTTNNDFSPQVLNWAAIGSVTTISYPYICVSLNQNAVLHSVKIDYSR